MASTFSEPHTIIQSWVTVETAQRLKAHARAEGCSLSSLVRDAMEENFAAAAKAERPAGGLPHARGAAPAPEGVDR